MVEFLEILNADNADMSDMREDSVEQTILDSGEWCPTSLARAGDLKEVQGLFDKGVFSIKGQTRPEGRYISLKLIKFYDITKRNILI